MASSIQPETASAIASMVTGGNQAAAAAAAAAAGGVNISPNHACGHPYSSGKLRMSRV